MGLWTVVVWAGKAASLSVGGRVGLVSLWVDLLVVGVEPRLFLDHRFKLSLMEHMACFFMDGIKAPRE